MTQVIEETRRFSVHARHVDAHHARVLEERSFEAAAVAYVEDFSHASQRRAMRSASSCAISAAAIEHCFRIDLDTGVTAACG